MFEMSTNGLNYAKFVQGHFEVQNCYKFVPKDKTGRICVCGVLLKDHLNDENLPSQDQWTPRCLKQVPTDAYGQLSFYPLNKLWSKPAKYLRLSGYSNLDDVYKLLFDYWNLNDAKPECLISLIGGFKVSFSFFGISYRKESMEEMKKKLLDVGLVKAIKATSAIVLTNGIDENLGDSIRLNQSLVWSNSDNTDLRYSIQTIGVLPWKNVQERSALINRSDNQPNHASYSGPFSRRTRSELFLDRYHTHFLLVDDGDCSKSESEKTEEFRAALEKKIAVGIRDDDGNRLGVNYTDSITWKLPPLCILIGGGVEAIDQVRKRVHHQIPIVLCKGTGGAANFLVDVVKMFETTANRNPNFYRQLDSKIGEFLQSVNRKALRPNAMKKTAKRLKRMIESICKQSKTDIYIFDATQDDMGLDSAILMYLLRKVGREKRLQYCMEWNSLELAEKTVFNSNISVASYGIGYCDYFVQALISGKLEFVRLFIDRGLNLNTHFTGEHLRELVENLIRKDASKMYLTDIYFGDSRDQVELTDMNRFLNGLSHRYKHSVYINAESSKATFDDPFEELCIWSIMAFKPTFALYFWDQCSEPVQTAIIGTYVCQLFLSRSNGWTTAAKECLTNLKHDLETLAIGMIRGAFSKDIFEATGILNRKSSNWCGTTCIELAALAGDKAFLATDACQYVIWNTWKGGTWAERPRQKHKDPNTSGLTYYFPQESVYGMVQLPKDNDAAERNDQTRERSDWTLGTASRRHNSSGCSKMNSCHNIPMLKFVIVALLYVIYIILYAYVLLFSFRPKITGAEIAFQVWTYANLLEEIYLIFMHPGRWKGWWKYSSISAFSRIQFLSIVIPCIGLVLRSISYGFNLARLFLAIGFILCMFRLFKVYFLNSKLGPKVIMIRRMTHDLVMFLLILVIMLLSYTVVSRSLIHPDRSYFGGVFTELFYHGTWVLFGELQDELAQVTSPGCFENDTMGAFETFDCVVQHWPPPIFLAIYCFLGTVLLINLLIAAFSYIFQEVQEQSDQLWRYYMFFMVKEYVEKSCLPPPFCIIQYAYQHYHSRKALLQKPAHSKASEYSVVFENTIRSEMLDNAEDEDNENLAAKILKKIHRSDSNRRTRGGDLDRGFSRYSGLRLVALGGESRRQAMMPTDPTGNFVLPVDGTGTIKLHNLPCPNPIIRAMDVIDSTDRDRKSEGNEESLEEMIDDAINDMFSQDSSEGQQEVEETEATPPDGSTREQSVVDHTEDEEEDDLREEEEKGGGKEGVDVADVDVAEAQARVAVDEPVHHGRSLLEIFESMTEEERKRVCPEILREIKSVLARIVDLDQIERPGRHEAFGRLINSLLETLPPDEAQELRSRIANICGSLKDSKSDEPKEN